MVLVSAGAIVFVTGLPSAGKSTFAARLQRELGERGVPACLLDGDVVRAALVPRPGYSPEERAHFYQTLANLGGMLAEQGLIAILAATANQAEYRAYARGLAPRFFEVFVDVPIEECRARDAKGLYAAYREGTIGQVPGEDAAYERPAHPSAVARGGRDESALRALVELLAPAPHPGDRERR